MVGAPATVVTAVVEITIRRIVQLIVSATKRFVPSVVMPIGPLNLAANPKSSAIRTAWQSGDRGDDFGGKRDLADHLVFAIRHVEIGPIRRDALGRLKRAAAHCAVEPTGSSTGDPAIVVTAPVASTIWRMVWLLLSVK